MKKITTLCLLFLCSLAAISQDTRFVQGIVQGKDGQGLSGVVVKARNSNVQAVSKDDGSFNIKVPLHVKELQASKDGYSESVATIDGTYIIFKLKFDNRGAKNKGAESNAMRDAELEARLVALENAKAKEKNVDKVSEAELEEKIRAEIEAKIRAEMEEEARLKAEIEAKIRAEFEAKAEAELRAKLETEARIKAEAAAKAKAEEEARLKAEAAAKAKAEEEARLKAEAAVVVKVEETAKVQVQDKQIQKSDEAVDLGLPSGLKWASCNIGASSPEESGEYFAWGEIDPKNNYADINSITRKKRMKQINGDVNYDVATAKLGASWYIPTKADFEELIRYCTWEWTTLNGVNGYVITGFNGNSIFLPATGYYDGTSCNNDGTTGEYWSSTPHKDAEFSYYLCYGGKNYYTYWNCRYVGRCVRPVKK